MSEAQGGGNKGLALLAAKREQDEWILSRAKQSFEVPRTLCLVVHHATMQRIDFDISTLVELASVATAGVSYDRGEWINGVDPTLKDEEEEPQIQCDSVEEKEATSGALIHESIGIVYDMDASCAVAMHNARSAGANASIVFTNHDDANEDNESDAEQIDEVVLVSDRPEPDTIAVDGVDAQPTGAKAVDDVTLEKDETEDDESFVFETRMPRLWQQTGADPKDWELLVSGKYDDQPSGVSPSEATVEQSPLIQEDGEDGEDVRLRESTQQGASSNTLSGLDALSIQVRDEGVSHAHDDRTQEQPKGDESDIPSEGEEWPLCIDILVVCDQYYCQVPGRAYLVERMKAAEAYHGCIINITLIAAPMKDLEQHWSMITFISANPLKLLEMSDDEQRELPILQLRTTDEHVLSNNGASFLPDMRLLLSAYAQTEPIATIVGFSDEKFGFDLSFLLSKEAQ